MSNTWSLRATLAPVAWCWLGLAWRTLASTCATPATAWEMLAHWQKWLWMVSFNSKHNTKHVVHLLYGKFTHMFTGICNVLNLCLFFICMHMYCMYVLYDINCWEHECPLGWNTKDVGGICGAIFCINLQLLPMHAHYTVLILEMNSGNLCVFCIAVPPSFKTKLQNVQLDIGKDVQFQCSTLCTPLPRIRYFSLQWEKDLWICIVRIDEKELSFSLEPFRSASVLFSTELFSTGSPIGKRSYSVTTVKSGSLRIRGNTAFFPFKTF